MIFMRITALTPCRCDNKANKFNRLYARKQGFFEKSSGKNACFFRINPVCSLMLWRLPHRQGIFSERRSCSFLIVVVEKYGSYTAAD